MTLWEKIKESMLSNPTSTVSEKEAKMTYEEMVIFAEKFAKGLTSSCYGILCNSELSCAMALLSCFAAGATAVPLSIRYGEKHCRKIIDKIGMPYIISDIYGELQTTDIDMGRYRKPLIKPALIMCTSGTSGNPKGVMLGEKNILTNVGDIAEYFDITEEDTVLIARPLYHCAVLTGEFLLALLKGANIVFSSDSFNPLSLIKIIEEKEITVFCATPTLLCTMASFVRGSDKLPLKKIAVSGECLTQYCAEKINRAFPNVEKYSVYGLTEASPRVSYLSPELFCDHCTSVGVPLKSVEVKIADDNGDELPYDEPGELLVKGDNVMIGYYGEPDKTAEAKRGGWLHTKDIAYKDKDGLIYIKGRKDNMIIRSGMNIYPQEIENELLSDRRVQDVLAYGITENGITKICLKIKGDFKSVSEVKELCIKLLPPYQVPGLIEIVDDIQKNGSGKKIRKI